MKKTLTSHVVLWQFSSNSGDCVSVDFSTLEKEKKVSDGKVNLGEGGRRGRKKREREGGRRGRERDRRAIDINSRVAVYIE